MQKRKEYIKEIARYALYELIEDALSQPRFSRYSIGRLLLALSKDGFHEASYSYAALLLRNKIGEARIM